MLYSRTSNLLKVTVAVSFSAALALLGVSLYDAARFTGKTELRLESGSGLMCFNGHVDQDWSTTQKESP